MPYDLFAPSLALIEKHEPYLHKVNNRLIELMNTEMKTWVTGAQIRLPVHQGSQGEDANTDNPWNEENPEALKALKALYELRNETDINTYLSKMGVAFDTLEALGLVEKHEPWLHTVADRLTDMMLADGI